MANMAKINDWLQVVGMFGLIASLVFVGMQIKQDHEIALSGIYQARSDATVNSSLAAINSPAFLDAGAKILCPQTRRPDYARGDCLGILHRSERDSSRK